MADWQSTDGNRKARRHRRRSHSHDELDGQNAYIWSGNDAFVQEEWDASEVQAIRIDREDGDTVIRSIASPSPVNPKMSEESHAPAQIDESTSVHRRRKKHHRSSEEKKHSRRKESSSKRQDSSPTYVYEIPTTKVKKTHIMSERRRLGRDEDEDSTKSSSDTEDEVPDSKVVKVKSREGKARKEKSRHRSVKDDSHKSKVGKEHRERPRSEEASEHKSKSHKPRRLSIPEPSPSSSHHKRSTSSYPPRVEVNPPGLKRGNTSASHASSHRSSSYAPSLTGTFTGSHRGSMLGSFFGVNPMSREPEKLVECLTCGADDIPRSKAPKLACGHRMCQSCLKRVFKMSITDPQHMPPKCCTSDHIPLIYVERLFDNNFKRTWNRKFQEFSAKNRVYCPGKRCGEWIKPGNIHKDADGRKYGKCSACQTKVCCKCGTKWHGKKECAQDEETKNLLNQAKEAGWQRCYGCKTMVELKEGCNHMTCRCKAEFCMICGLKWKTCNCPWFNYDTVDNMNFDRLLGNLNIPVRPATYQAELLCRRLQEREDETMARRLQIATLNQDYRGNIGAVHGIGNNANHFMNEDYVQQVHHALTRPMDEPNNLKDYLAGMSRGRGLDPHATGSPMPQNRPQPAVRRHWLRIAAWNAAQGRASERVVPRRSRSDYGSEAAVHAPLKNAEGRRSRTEPTLADLAGLPGGGSGRVDAWRTHVDPVEPEGGVLSM